jgi:hypothetical protein
MSTVWDWLFHATTLDWEVRLVYAAAVPQTLFVLGYGTRSRWWASLIGRALFTKALALAMLLDLSVFADIFGYDYPHREQITLVILILIFAGSAMQLLAWIKQRRRARRGGVDHFQHGGDK